MKTGEKVINKKIIVKGVITLLFIICIIILAQFAYAKYMSSTKGNTSADIASWNIKVNEKTDQSFSIELAETRRNIVQEAEVQDGYIGPGTSGAFEIKVDAEETDVSLEYNINMIVDYKNNTVFPKNLIFYSDSEMKNAIYHTDNVINLKGYIAQNDGNKVRSHIIYWKWDFETGQTQEDRDDNDEADSYWIGRRISIPITVVGEQVNRSTAENQCVVTFDANGGTITGYGNSEKMTKTVTCGEQYGTLPVPTREGYVFEGWTIKNLFELKNSVDYVYFQTPYEIDLINNSISISGYETLEYTFIEIHLPTLKANTWYTISGNIELENLGNIMWIRISGKRGITAGNTWILNKSIRAGHFSESFLVGDYDETTPAILLYGSHGERDTNAKAIYSNIKIEEGTKETPYDAGNIEANTVLMQDSNHTLTARWRKQ